jgi:hypothetical protein
MKKKFTIPGMYHPITVKILPEKNFVSGKDEETMGYYLHIDCEIQLLKTLTKPVMLHTLYHEISHHIVDTLAEIKDEEDRCNILGTYLIALGNEKEKIEKILK